MIANEPTPSAWSDVPAYRRRIMQRNRRKDTSCELAVRRALHARGLRYRVDMPVRLEEFRPIRVDVAFTRQQVAVFVDGCFWHGCPEHGTSPTANASYWKAKIEANKARDERQTSLLRRGGWQVIRVWEHEDPLAVAERVAEAVLRESTPR